MSTFQLDSLSKEERIKLIGEFYDAMNCMNNREETRRVLRDLLNPSEIAMLARRIQIAIFLKKGFSYRQISELMKAGITTVKNVKKSMQKHGEGYELIFKRLKRIRKKKARKRKFKNKHPADVGTFQWLKNRYPGHFLLFDLVDFLAGGGEDASVTYKEADAIDIDSKGKDS